MFPATVLENFYVKTRNSIEEGKSQAPFGYVIPVDAPEEPMPEDQPKQQELNHPVHRPAKLIDLAQQMSGGEHAHVPGEVPQVEKSQPAEDQDAKCKGLR